MASLAIDIANQNVLFFFRVKKPHNCLMAKSRDFSRNISLKVYLVLCCKCVKALAI
jgi:hypothetical protein